MLNIAYYYENENELELIKSTIESHYSSNKIIFKSYSYYSVSELLHFCNTRIPDIIFFNSATSNQIKKAILSLKKNNPKLISILTENLRPSNKNTINYAAPEYLLFDPFYITYKHNKKQLLYYANLAYKAITIGDEFFEYYKKPEYTVIPINDIVYFQSEGRKINLICSESSIHENDSFYQKLDDLAEELKCKCNRFFRVHKSTLVNQKYISTFDRFNVKLINGEILKISKTEYYRELKKMTLNSAI